MLRLNVHLIAVLLRSCRPVRERALRLGLLDVYTPTSPSRFHNHECVRGKLCATRD
jgi:hypothetical protein